MQCWFSCNWLHSCEIPWRAFFNVISRDSTPIPTWNAETLFYSYKLTNDGAFMKLTSSKTSSSSFRLCGHKLSNSTTCTSSIFFKLNFCNNYIIFKDWATVCTDSISSSWIYFYVRTSTVFTFPSWHDCCNNNNYRILLSLNTIIGKYINNSR